MLFTALDFSFKIENWNLANVQVQKSSVFSRPKLNKAVHWSPIFDWITIGSKWESNLLPEYWILLTTSSNIVSDGPFAEVATDSVFYYSVFHWLDFLCFRHQRLLWLLLYFVFASALFDWISQSTFPAGTMLAHPLSTLHVFSWNQKYMSSSRY